jgi:hypothetical protein
MKYRKEKLFAEAETKHRLADKGKESTVFFVNV